jgi:hypothetical protein
LGDDLLACTDLRACLRKPVTDYADRLRVRRSEWCHELVQAEQAR